MRDELRGAAIDGDRVDLRRLRVVRHVDGLRDKGDDFAIRRELRIADASKAHHGIHGEGLFGGGGNAEKSGRQRARDGDSHARYFIGGPVYRFLSLRSSSNQSCSTGILLPLGSSNSEIRSRFLVSRLHSQASRNSGSKTKIF